MWIVVVHETRQIERSFIGVDNLSRCWLNSLIGAAQAGGHFSVTTRDSQLPVQKLSR